MADGEGPLDQFQKYKMEYLLAEWSNFKLLWLVVKLLESNQRPECSTYYLLSK